MHLLCLVVVFIVGCIAASEASCNWSNYPNMLLSATGKPYLKIGSLDACKSVCEKSADCQSIDFAVSNTDCYLYAAKGPKEFSSDFGHFDCNRTEVSDVVSSSNTDSFKTNYPGSVKDLSSVGHGVSWNFQIATFDFDWPETDSFEIPLGEILYIYQMTFAGSDNLNYFRGAFHKNNGQVITTNPIGPNDKTTTLKDVNDVKRVDFYLAASDFSRNVSLKDVRFKYCIGILDPILSIVTPTCAFYDLLKDARQIGLLGGIIQPGGVSGSFSVSLPPVYPYIELDLASADIGTVEFYQVLFDSTSNFDKVVINVWNGAAVVPVYSDNGVATNVFSLAQGVYFADSVRGDRFRVTMIPNPDPTQGISGTIGFSGFSTYAIILQ